MTHPGHANNVCLACYQVHLWKLFITRMSMYFILDVIYHHRTHRAFLTKRNIESVLAQLGIIVQNLLDLIPHTK